MLVLFCLVQLDVTSAQLLVTDSDFRDKGFRKQLDETVKSLLALRVIPIFNETDAVSTRRAPYEVCEIEFISTHFTVLIVGNHCRILLEYFGIMTV